MSMNRISDGQALQQPMCGTCRWWREPKPVPPALAGMMMQNEYGYCMNAMNDVLDWNIGGGRATRIVSSTRAESYCREHQPKEQERGE